MISLSIDTIRTEVPEGTTILQAARSIGIVIPTMCYLKGTQEHPSCMVCMVRDNRNGRTFPSCAMPVEEGMEILTSDPEMDTLRKESLELLLSDHVGDCEAPCRLTCPAFMNIPLMNRMIAENKFDEALSVVREEIALPLILGYICPAPCEKACKRKQIDGSVSICLLKRSTADDSLIYTPPPLPLQKSGKRVAIIGTGPAGLSAAFYLLKAGHDCLLFDKQEEAGGALRYSIPEGELPREVLDLEIDMIKKMGAVFLLKQPTSVNKLRENGYGNFDAYILATGSLELHPLEDTFSHHPGTAHFIHKETLQTSIPDVFACGNIVKDQHMAVRAGAQGKLAALNVHRFLNAQPLIHDASDFNSVVGPLKSEEFPEYLKESADTKQVVPLKGFIGGFSREEAIAEASRCMHCDCRKVNSCLLRQHANTYHADRKHFAGVTRKTLVKQFQHDLVVYEPEKCIKCGICVEIASRHKTLLGFTYIGRGFDVEVNVPFKDLNTNALGNVAEECANACPTGALAIKNKEDIPSVKSQ